MARPQRKAAVEAKARIHCAAGGQPKRKPSKSPRAAGGHPEPDAGAAEERRAPDKGGRPGGASGAGEGELPEAGQPGPSGEGSEEEEEELAGKMPRGGKEDGDEKAGPSGAAKKDAEEEASTAPLPEKVRA